MTARISSCILLLSAAVVAPSQGPVFRSGTRLVEIDVVIRDKNGPVTGLSQDDFTLYDCSSSERSVYANQRRQPCKGKRERIDLFREVGASSAPIVAPPPLPPGSVTNRPYVDGEPISSATVVILDQLNTPFELKGYERKQAAEFLQSVGENNRIALYSLGENLHLLQDFTDNPAKLMDAIAKLDSGDQLTPATGGFSRTEAAVIASVREDVTVEAVKTIVRHLEGVQGRKNLVWIAGGFQFFDPPFGQPRARILLGQANVAVYPVMVRSLQASGVLNMTARGGRRSLPMPDLNIQFRNQQLGESLGGTGFGDAGDALKAVKTAEEDSKNYYVLGFYPAEADLDGTTHQLTLEVSKAVTHRPELTMHYRQTYGAEPANSLPANSRLNLEELFRDPLNAAGIGLSATIEPDPAKAGGQVVQTQVDVGDLQFHKDGDHFVANLQIATRFEANEAGRQLATQPVVRNVEFRLSEAEVQSAKGARLPVSVPFPADAKPGLMHVVVLDASSGAVGTLRVTISDK